MAVCPSSCSVSSSSCFCFYFFIQILIWQAVYVLVFFTSCERVVSFLNDLLKISKLHFFYRKLFFFIANWLFIVTELTPMDHLARNPCRDFLANPIPPRSSRVSNWRPWVVVREKRSVLPLGHLTFSNCFSFVEFLFYFNSST